MGVSSPSSHSSNAVASSDVVADGVSLMPMAAMMCLLDVLSVPEIFSLWPFGQAIALPAKAVPVIRRARTRRGRGNVDGRRDAGMINPA